MNLKHFIVCGIVAVLLSTAAFCAGMRHALTHMEITARGNTAEIVLHENVYTPNFN